MKEALLAPLPFDPSKLSPSDLALYDALVEKRRAQGAPFGGPYAALMNHPVLCGKIEDLGFYLKFQGHLPRDVYQFVVLSVARSTGAAFEWIDHVRHAEAAGVPAAVIGALQEHGLEGGVFAAHYDLAAKVLAATLAWRDIPQSVQDESIQLFGIEGFVELVVLSGFYQMFAAVNQGFAVSAPQGAPKPF
ncbi:carboxymuconolactone decarboxylase [Methylocapsa palsarum]|uniref:4-carboxymuconolactone decarboxylase n=1 Tax=Methylocapsa palsarum TaxID=1612308 RepID=A0A1I3ZW70_9HYPH|nr:carboxymuconolactone decarboxylase [Methylocapsa palsarum]SFK48263.1 4-carboxymuconolactone decarboxylase [Methylocapsa palsarum]